MAIINVNLSGGDEGGGGEVHPDGEHLVRIADSEIRDNKAGDGQYINWRLKVLNTDNNRPVYLITSLKPTAIWNLRNFVRAAGVNELNLENFDTAELHGTELYVNIKTEVYENTPRNTVSGPYKRAAV